ncbi:MAG: FliH/SctL family protein [Christensenella hongkongensis]|uniref:FliH/SctL family protein n=1 Tax=Christensenella hongkongensis TaxID=270498 RepID=UPI002A750B97|nr:FliH/SctL family protein [Christensenella hongkongensis]MDY3004285.1 FliH/SctL family protein [Christensenella hongkongensis]
MFRIDKHSLTAEDTYSAEMVELPKLEDLVELVSTFQEEEITQEQEEPDASPAEKKQSELARLEAEIQKAKKQAELIIAGAQEQAEQIRRDAQAQGYQDGLSGAAEAAATERQKEKEAAEQALMTLVRAKEQMMDGVEESVLDISLYIAEHIVKQKLDQSEEAFLNVLSDTLSRVQSDSDMILKVSKHEYEYLFAKEEEYVTELRNSGITVKQDLSLQKGDCVIETEYGTIRSGVRTQLKRMGYALREVG